MTIDYEAIKIFIANQFKTIQDELEHDAKMLKNIDNGNILNADGQQLSNIEKAAERTATYSSIYNTLVAYNSLSKSAGKMLEQDILDELKKPIEAITKNTEDISFCVKLVKEIEAELKDKRYNGVTIEDLALSENENLKRTLLEIVAPKLITKNNNAVSDTRQNRLKNTNTFLFMLDGITRDMGKGKQKNEIINGQMQFFTPTGKNHNRDIGIIYFYDFNSLKAQGLPPYITIMDKKVLDAVSSCYMKVLSINNLNLYEKEKIPKIEISITDIYREMGYTTKLGAAQRKLIAKSLVILGGARITFSNDSEIDANYNYDRLNIKNRPLLHWNYDLEFFKDGRKVETIEVLEPPVIAEFAVKRGYFCTVNKKLLQDGLRNNDGVLQIKDYLQQKIIYSLRTNKECKFSIKELLTDCALKAGTVRYCNRYIDEYLAYLKLVNLIIDYKVTKELVTITPLKDNIITTEQKLIE